MTKPIPDGYHSVTPYLFTKNATEAIEFYKKAFGAEEVLRLPFPDGSALMHAEIRIGNSIVMLSDENPRMDALGPQSRGGATGSLMIYVEDVDASFTRAVEAGATVKTPLTDMFWGDRFGQLTDPFGHHWSLATHIEDVSPEEIDRRTQEWFAKMGEKGG